MQKKLVAEMAKGLNTSVIPTYECKQCGFQWHPRVDNPKKCPNCQSKDWASSTKKQVA